MKKKILVKHGANPTAGGTTYLDLDLIPPGQRMPYEEAQKDLCYEGVLFLEYDGVESLPGYRRTKVLYKPLFAVKLTTLQQHFPEVAEWYDKVPGFAGGA